MNMIALGNTYLTSTRPSVLKKQNITNVFEAMQRIANQININKKNKNIALNRKRG